MQNAPISVRLSALLTGEYGTITEEPRPVSTHPSLLYLSTLWIPLDPLVQEWARFGQEASKPAAFGAVGMAFMALSWEAIALQEATRLAHSWKGQHPPESLLPENQGVEPVLQYLSEAHSCWQSAVLWLGQPTHLEPLEPTEREMAQRFLEQATIQVQRLRALLQEVQREHTAARQQGAIAR